MNIDIRKHAFYLALAGVLVLYIVIYFVLAPDSVKMTKTLRAMKDSHNEISRRLEKKQDLPNDELIAYHRERGDQLRSLLETVRTELKKKDYELEQWFEDIAKDLGPEQYPAGERFRAVYARERNKLVEYYAGKNEGMRVGKPLREWGFGVTDESKIDPKSRMRDIEKILPLKYQELKDVTMDLQMKRTQKDFWLIQKLLKVFDSGKLRRLSKYSFVNEWPNNSEDVFFRRDIEISGQIEFGDISNLLEEVLNNPYFMTEIKKVSIKRDGSYRPEPIVIGVNWDQSNEDALKKYFRSNPSKARLPHVEISIEFSILDYQDQKL